ncbi:nucleotidyltransferase family protein [Sphingomonas sp. RHCKR47]|uniref:nucleotidyltransferase domain-containing protein n=1 Tax=Sphingomonas citricola TaxID=2862498 RepID=UPI001C666FF0|nr:nucleotidyltransferase family protein [Sphingomonas citricola]MBW6523875.1 nucleotidyltransferase family protein [Sphingomonas citricola]
MTAASLLARVLAEPDRAAGLDPTAWNALIAAARAEQLIGSLALRVDLAAVPPTVADVLHDARDAAIEQRRTALWEAEMTRRVLAPLGVPLVLLKGTAFVAAGLSAGQGRHIGDLDLLAPRGVLPAVEQALLEAGWAWAKPDAYDDDYYRRWMHELPPLIHRERDRMIDVHHTILPPTARPIPDADALIAGAVPLGNGLSVLAPADMVIHAALHLFADGDLAGGLRNLWDIDHLLRECADDDADFWLKLHARAAEHQASAYVARAARLSARLFGTPIPSAWNRPRMSDQLFARRLLARDDWGRETRPATRLAFYVRSHWIRMPPLLLARHLLIKARRRAADARAR